MPLAAPPKNGPSNVIWLGYADSEPGKLINLLGEPWHVSLQKLSLGDFEAASTDQDHAMVIVH